MTERPLLHSTSSGVKTADWALDTDTLDYLATVVTEGWTTIETGCGYSTLVLAAGGATHTAISPNGDEHAAIAEWAESHAIDLHRVTFVTAASHVGLPKLDPVTVDLLLIDGSHALPAPFVDWYLVADRLRQGGLVVVDDTQLPAPAALAKFLRGDRSRWSRETVLSRSEIFRKLSAGAVTDVQHIDQLVGRSPLIVARRWRAVAASKFRNL